MNEGRGDTETPRVADATSRYSRRIRGVRRVLAGVGGEGSAEPGGIRRIGRNPNSPNNYPAHSGNYVSERVVEVNARSRRTMTAVGPMRRVCVLVSILLLGRSRHTCDAPGSYVRFTSRLHVDTLTQQKGSTTAHPQGL